MKKTIEPRMFTQEMAASYCGVSIPTLLRNCPVVPTVLAYGVQRRQIRAAIAANFDPMKQ